MTIDEILQLAGVTAITIPTGQLDELATTRRPQIEVEGLSLFRKKGHPEEKATYEDDEKRFRSDLAAFSDGRGTAKLADVSIHMAIPVDLLADEIF